MSTAHAPTTVDGTAGGEVPVYYDLPKTQITVSGRATGTLTITGKSSGSDVFEAFQPALTLDLSVERTALVEGYILQAINIDVSVGGDDFDVTITQWEG